MDRPVTLCDRCEIAATCLLNYDGILCRKNRTAEPTNGDLLRSMTDEKLAEWIGSITKDATSDWLTWLKQEGNSK